MHRPGRFSARDLVRIFVGASLATLALFAIALWLAWSGSIDSNRAEALENDMQRLGRIHAAGGVAMLRDAVDYQVGERFGERMNFVILAVDAQGRRIAGNLAQWPAHLAPSAACRRVTVSSGSGPVDLMALVRELPGGVKLFVGRDVCRFERLENLFVFGMVTTCTIMSLAGAAAGWLMRRSLLSQVHDINHATHAIMEGDLRHRLPERSGEYELNALAANVNSMFDHIQNLVEGVRNVSNSIAHDLRTPLTELRMRIEDLAATRPGPEQTFAEIDGAIADVDRVIGIFNALLRMAEIESGVRRAGFACADAADIAAQAVEIYQPLAELKDIALDMRTDGPLLVRCDSLLLAQAVSNLIDNAIKYSAPGGSVEVHAGHAEGGIMIAVRDVGPGIRDEEKSKVLERFYRCESSRATPGVGLGLSLVATVARLHGGLLTLADNHPGLAATLLLPAPAPARQPLEADGVVDPVDLPC